MLCGPIGCGKSTLIQNALGSAARRAGGFVTLRDMEQGVLKGFDLAPAPVLCGVYCQRLRFLSFENGVRRDDSVFRTHAVRLLDDAGGTAFAILDEIGGFELLIPEFAAALDRFLNGAVPCVGVLKSLPAAGALHARAALPPGYPDAAKRLRARLEQAPDTLVLETTGRDDARAEACLRSWAEQYAH